MIGKSTIDTVKETAASRAELAYRLAQDKKFRKQLISAIGHGAKARRTVKSRTSFVPVVTRLASDQHLRDELKSAVDDLRSAVHRAQKKRSHTGRKVAIGLVAAGAAAAAWLSRGKSEN